MTEHEQRIATLTAALEEARLYLEVTCCVCPYPAQKCRRCAALAIIEKALSEGERKP